MVKNRHDLYIGFFIMIFAVILVYVAEKNDIGGINQSYYKYVHPDLPDDDQMRIKSECVMSSHEATGGGDYNPFRYAERNNFMEACLINKGFQRDRGGNR